MEAVAAKLEARGREVAAAEAAVAARLAAVEREEAELARQDAEQLARLDALKQERTEALAAIAAAKARDAALGCSCCLSLTVSLCRLRRTA
jgi:hypothetical protein